MLNADFQIFYHTVITMICSAKVRNQMKWRVSSRNVIRRCSGLGLSGFEEILVTCRSNYPGNTMKTLTFFYDAYNLFLIKDYQIAVFSVGAAAPLNFGVLARE